MEIFNHGYSSYTRWGTLQPTSTAQIENTVLLARANEKSQREFCLSLTIRHKARSFSPIIVSFKHGGPENSLDFLAEILEWVDAYISV